jgi:tetratricopeptide (TPR) repeat protein
MRTRLRGAWRLAAFATALPLVMTLASHSLAVGPDVTELDSDPSYRDARRLIAEKNHASAIPLLEQLLKDNPGSPVLLNWLGYTHRKMKDYPTSKRFYDAALKADPTYLPALEYQGEWFLEMGDIASAKANLTRLEQLCGRCHEWADLNEALAKAAP